MCKNDCKSVDDLKKEIEDLKNKVRELENQLIVQEQMAKNPSY